MVSIQKEFSCLVASICSPDHKRSYNIRYFLKVQGQIFEHEKTELFFYQKILKNHCTPEK